MWRLESNWGAALIHRRRKQKRRSQTTKDCKACRLMFVTTYPSCSSYLILLNVCQGEHLTLMLPTGILCLQSFSCVLTVWQWKELFANWICTSGYLYKEERAEAIIRLGLPSSVARLTRKIRDKKWCFLSDRGKHPLLLFIKWTFS